MSTQVHLPEKMVTSNHHSYDHRTRVANPRALKKRSQKKYHLPVIGHFADRSIEFSSIIEAEAATGINYTLIFEACIGKIFKAKNVIWEFKKGNHYIKYKAYYINVQETYTRKGGFNG